MKNINYYGQHITVSDEVAEFLEEDRRREAAQDRSDRRHINYVGMDIASIPDLFTNEPSDPTFEQAFRNLRLGDCGKPTKICLVMNASCCAGTTTMSIPWKKSVHSWAFQKWRFPNGCGKFLTI